jgi:dienelactone hydrolase
METWGIVVLVVMIVVFLYLATCIIVVGLLNHRLFGVRGKDPSHPVYVHYEDYTELDRQSYEMDFHGYKIRGYLYSDSRVENPKAFIILSHGMFGTHLQYLVDVRYLTQEGYLVLCYDQYGVGLSQGESQVSLSHGILVLDEVIKDVERRNLQGDLPIYLYGHSWGAYCSLGVLGKHPEVSKAVLRSGPVKPSKAGLRLLSMQSRFFYFFVRPVFALCLRLTSTGKALVDCTKELRKNRNTKILVVQSKNDPMVLLKDSQYQYFMKHPSSQVNLLLTEKGLHNTIITEESYHAFLSKAKEYKSILKIEDEKEKALAEERFLSSLSRADMVVYSDEVKDVILKFLA